MRYLRGHRPGVDARTTPAYDDSVRDDKDKGREQSFPSEEAEVEGVADLACPD